MHCVRGEKRRKGFCGETRIHRSCRKIHLYHIIYHVGLNPFDAVNCRASLSEFIHALIDFKLQKSAGFQASDVDKPAASLHRMYSCIVLHGYLFGIGPHSICQHYFKTICSLTHMCGISCLMKAMQRYIFESGNTFPVTCGLQGSYFDHYHH